MLTVAGVQAVDGVHPLGDDSEGVAPLVTQKNAFRIMRFRRNWK
jgi:hypothetical protein